MNNNPGAALFARQALQYSTGVHITFFDGAGNHRVDLTLGESGPQLMLFDPGKICRTSLGVYPQGPSLSLSDKNGDTVVFLHQGDFDSGVSLDGGPLTEGGIPGLPRLVLSVTEYGVTMGIVDAEGNVIWAAP